MTAEEICISIRQIISHLVSYQMYGRYQKNDLFDIILYLLHITHTHTYIQYYKLYIGRKHVNNNKVIDLWTFYSFHRIRKFT